MIVYDFREFPAFAVSLAKMSTILEQCMLILTIVQLCLLFICTNEYAEV